LAASVAAELLIHASRPKILAAAGMLTAAAAPPVRVSRARTQASPLPIFEALHGYHRIVLDLSIALAFIIGTHPPGVMRVNHRSPALATRCGSWPFVDKAIFGFFGDSAILASGGAININAIGQVVHPPRLRSTIQLRHRNHAGKIYEAAIRQAAHSSVEQLLPPWLSMGAAFERDAHKRCRRRLHQCAVRPSHLVRHRSHLMHAVSQAEPVARPVPNPVAAGSCRHDG
jgi:hypothetical protein